MTHPTTTEKVQEIYDNILPELSAHGIEDTPLHRLWALQGLRNAWREDPDDSMEKLSWQMALNGEIWRLMIELHSTGIRIF